MAVFANIRDDLGLERFGSAANSRRTTAWDRIKGALMRPLAKRALRAMDRAANSG